MMCYPAGTSVEFGGVCEGLDGNLLFQDGGGGGSLDGNIVFDLVTAGGSCTGQACKKAARALINCASPRSKQIGMDAARFPTTSSGSKTSSNSAFKLTLNT